MARQESDRDDLYEELKSALVRWELRIPDLSLPVIAGIRDAGRWSIYFGPDPVFHFDADGRLLRAYAQGNLFRTQGQTLARLRRLRTEHTSELLRHDLTAGELVLFLAQVQAALEPVQQSLAAGNYEILRSLPQTASPADVLLPCLQAALPAEQPLAPAYRTRRT